MSELSSKVYQYAFINLGEAYKRFFKGLSKYPKFKCKGRNDRFTLDNSGRPIRLGGLIQNLPFIKQVRTFEPLPDCLTKKVTIYKKAGEWYISFSIDPSAALRVNTERSRGVEKTFETTPKKRERVGVDFGIKTLAVLSSGVQFEGLKPYRNAQKKLARVQRKLAKKVKGCKNYSRALLQVQKLHRRVANLRKDYLHKMTTYIAKNHSVVVIEDLNVSGMMANHKLAKAIGEAGLYEARRQLDYKCERYGSKLVVADRFFPSSQLCSNCGKTQPMPLSQRTYECGCCGNKIDRDWNASLNLVVHQSNFAGSDSWI